jgi:hypothetical protein
LKINGLFQSCVIAIDHGASGSTALCFQPIAVVNSFTVSVEAGKLELNPEPVNLARLIDEVIGTAGQLAEKNQNRLVVEAQENLAGQGIGVHGAPAGRRDTIIEAADNFDRENTSTSRRNWS